MPFRVEDALKERGANYWPTKLSLSSSRLENPVTVFPSTKKPTAIYCHGTAALVDLKLSDGSYLCDHGRPAGGFGGVKLGEVLQLAAIMRHRATHDDRAGELLAIGGNPAGVPCSCLDDRLRLNDHRRVVAVVGLETRIKTFLGVVETVSTRM